MDTITTSCISSSDDFQSLQPHWNTLLRKSSFPNWFLTWEWLHTWWDVYANDSCELSIIVVKSSGKIIGIAPFYIQVINLLSMPIRRLALLGTLENEEDEVCSEYLDIIAATKDRKLVAQHIVEWFSNNQDKWDKAVLTDLLEGCCILSELKDEFAKHSCNTIKTDAGARFVTTLPSSWDDYLSGLSKNKRKEIRQNIKRLNNEGEIAEIVIEDDQQLDWAYDELVRLHSERWQKRGLPGAFVSKQFNKFHKKLLPTLHEKGWLDLRFISLNGENISVLYNFVFGDTVYSYQSGFNYDQHSPGCLSDSMAMQHFISQGYKHYDFLKGEPGSYKGSMVGDMQPMYEMTVYSNSIKSLFIYVIESIKKQLQKICRCFRGKE